MHSENSQISENSENSTKPPVPLILGNDYITHAKNSENSENSTKPPEPLILENDYITHKGLLMCVDTSWLVLTFLHVVSFCKLLGTFIDRSLIDLFICKSFGISLKFG
jgi:hypothetical protein